MKENKACCVKLVKQFARNSKFNCPVHESSPAVCPVPKESSAHCHTYIRKKNFHSNLLFTCKSFRE